MTIATYEDTGAHLSESEREVTGQVFALAEYLVHDLYGALPFMAVDTPEALNSERIAALIKYSGECVKYLVAPPPFPLLEDATALDKDHQRVAEV